MKSNTNIDIALTHIITRKKQTLVAALGVLIGVAIYLFMNSLISGFTNYSRDEIFKNAAHIKIYKEDEISNPVGEDKNATNVTVITNPQILSNSKKIIDPIKLLHIVKQEPYVTNAMVQVDFSAFYNKGTAQVKGTGNGVDIRTYNAMFGTEKYMVSGSIDNLQSDANGIIIGSGIADKLYVKVGDNLAVSSSYNVSKNLKIVGIFKSGNNIMDNTKSFVNIATAQQFIKENQSFVSNIFINTINADKSEEYAKQLQQLTDYKVEDWKETNADILAGERTRKAMMTAISLSILLVASFGIYNILSATISQKLNDIAILKAIGFVGGDVVKIFVTEAIIMGLLGTILGLMFGAILIGIMQNVYMGGPVGYFPIHFEQEVFIRSFILGISITFFAGFFPARKAANVDPVSIFRK